MAGCQTCDLEKRTSSLERITQKQEVRIRALEENAKNSRGDKKEFYRRFEDLATADQKHNFEIKNIFEKLDSIDGKTADIDRKVDEINSRPAKDIGQLKSAIISTIGSAIGTGIIALILFTFMKGM